MIKTTSVIPTYFMSRLIAKYIVAANTLIYCINISNNKPNDIKMAGGFVIFIVSTTKLSNTVNRFDPYNADSLRIIMLVSPV